MAHMQNRNFFVTYCDGNDFARFYPIFYSMIGVCKMSKKGIKLDYIMFPGFTAPISFLINFLGGFLTMILAGISAEYAIVLSFVWYIGVAVLTGIASKFTSRGKKSRQALKDFLNYLTF